MKGRPRKPVGNRQGRSGKLLALPPGATPPPPSPAGLSPRAATLWGTLWSSQIARAWDPHTDAIAVADLARLYDERERAWQAYQRDRLVEGSMGQVRLNPLWSVVRDCAPQIEALSDRLGLTPRARLQLGVTYAQAAMGIAELNTLLDTDDQPDTQGTP